VLAASALGIAATVVAPRLIEEVLQLKALEWLTKVAWGPSIVVGLAAASLLVLAFNAATDEKSAGKIDKAALIFAVGATIAIWARIPFVYKMSFPQVPLPTAIPFAALLWFGTFVPALTLTKSFMSTHEDDLGTQQLVGGLAILCSSLTFAASWIHNPGSGSFGKIVIAAVTFASFAVVLTVVGFLGSSIWALVTSTICPGSFRRNRSVLASAWLFVPTLGLFGIAIEGGIPSPATDQEVPQERGGAPPINGGLPVQIDFQVYGLSSPARLSGADAGGSVYNPNAEWGVRSIVLAVGPSGTLIGKSTEAIDSGIRSGLVRRYTVPVNVPPLASVDYRFSSGLDANSAYEWMLWSVEGDH
jgi:hypothetical protein